MKSNLLFSAAIALLLSSCTIAPNQSPPEQLSVNIAVKPDLALEFTGRGAAAGVALMSSMGAAGIAIGAAIDIGIGKDIETAANQAGFSFADSAQTALTKYCNQHNCKVSAEPAQSLTIEQYQFYIVSGEITGFTITATAPNQAEPIVVNVSADNSTISKSDWHFARLKEDGNKVAAIWQYALAQLAQQWLATSSLTSK